MSIDAANTTEPTSQLSTEQIKAYHDEGYVVVNNVFTVEEVSELRSVTDQFVELSRGITQSNDVLDLEPRHTAECPKVRRIKHPHQQHQVYNRALRNARVLNIVSQVIGEGIRYQGGKLNMKPPEFGSPVEWHQDWAFFPHTNSDVLAVGIALDDATVANGCLLVVPGSHKGPILDHHQDGTFIGAVTPDGWEKDAVAVELSAGEISLHHVRLLHGSAPNTSSQSRRFLLFEYAANDAWPLAGRKSWEDLETQVITGELSIEPRLEQLPVRLPYPQPPRSSIFEIQRPLKTSGFAMDS